MTTKVISSMHVDEKLDETNYNLESQGLIPFK